MSALYLGTQKFKRALELELLQQQQLTGKHAKTIKKVLRSKHGAGYWVTYYNVGVKEHFDFDIVTQLLAKWETEIR